jgi:hypothetical protein
MDPTLPTNIPKEGIKLSFFDIDGKKVSGISVDQANEVANKYPDIKFYFQNGDGVEQELTIDQVNNLLPQNLLPTTPDCPTSPQVCGPPLVRFFGGGGYGASANAIISPESSSIIGFDIVNSGFGFLDTPSAGVIDNCGNGSGSNLQINMEDDDKDTTNEDGTNETETLTDECSIPRKNFEKKIRRKIKRSKRIKNITIISPGNGYLAVPNGSLGGNERVWKEPDEGYVKTKCGGYYVVQPYRPIPVKKGDTFYAPNEPGKTIEEDGFLDLPLVPVIPPKPETVGPKYTVILCIEEIKVLNKGFGYRPGDKLIITPNNGTLTELIINERGEIEDVKILKGGCGYIDLPEIKTDSATGFNATFSTIFKPIKIDPKLPVEEQVSGGTEDVYKPFFVPNNIELITVIDCVGRTY